MKLNGEQGRRMSLVLRQQKSFLWRGNLPLLFPLPSRELGVSGGVLFASYTRVSKIPLSPPFEKGELFPKSHPTLKKHAMSRVAGEG